VAIQHINTSAAASTGTKFSGSVFLGKLKIVATYPATGNVVLLGRNDQKWAKECDAFQLPPPKKWTLCMCLPSALN